MSQEFYESISLKDLVSMSDVVAVATFENPAVSKKGFQYVVARKEQGDKIQLKFESQVYHFKLIEVLKDLRSHKSAKPVSLISPRLSEEFDEQYRYESSGETKSPIISTYTGKIGEAQISEIAKKAQPVILFFRENNIQLDEPRFGPFKETFGEYDLFAAWFSIDEITLKGKVIRLIREEPPYLK